MQSLVTGENSYKRRMNLKQVAPRQPAEADS